MKFAIPLFFALSASAVIIPPDRIYPWQGNVGIPGGIPNRTTIFCNVLVSIPGTNRVAVGDNTTDDTIALQTAINLCPSNQVVYLPTATYKTTAALSFKGHDGVTLRGDGRGLTIIEGHSTSGSTIAFGTDGNTYEQYEFGSPRVVANISSGTDLGSSNIVVSSATGISTGVLLNIDELNDTNGYLRCTGYGNEGFNSDASRSQDGAGTRCLGQVAAVTAVNGTTITIDPPLIWFFTNVGSAQSTTFPLQTTLSGIENLTVDNNNTGCEQTFSMWSVKWCWIKNVESEWADGDHVIVDSSVRCEIRDSYFHDAYSHQPGSHDSTIILRCHSSGILVENNCLRRLHVGMIVETGGGGDVIAYNFMTNQFDSASTNGMFLDLVYHGSHPIMVLFEGNVCNGYSQDGVWGTATAGTLLRNFISGQNWNCPPYTGRGAEQTGSYNKEYQANRCFNLAGTGITSYFNLVGNVIGTTNMGNFPTYSPVYTNIAPMTRQYDHEGLILSLGYAGGGDDGTAANDNSIPWTTLINHGNWDVVHKAQIWSNSIPDQVIPNSYYLAGKPAFFGSLPWPPVEPSSSTNTGLNGMIIPAGYKYFTGTDPPAAPAPFITTGGGATISGGAHIGQ